MSDENEMLRQKVKMLETKFKIQESKSRRLVELLVSKGIFTDIDVESLEK